MRQGIVTPEKNNGKKLTIPVRTRTPLEAMALLRQGHPIDIMAGYYEDEISDDFWMMDKTAKLHKLAELRERTGQLKQNIQFQVSEIEQANQIKFQNAKESEQNNQFTQRDNTENLRGTVSKSGTTGERDPGNNAGK